MPFFKRACPVCVKDLDVLGFCKDDLEVIEAMLDHLPFCLRHEEELEELVLRFSNTSDKDMENKCEK